jgi:predicted ester cyclase
MNREGVKSLFAMYHSAFSNLETTIEDLIAEGDKVVARVRMKGTHTGDFWGVPPTGRWVNLTAIYIVRIADGKIVEHWGEEDGMKVFKQLGFKLKLEQLPDTQT